MKQTRTFVALSLDSESARTVGSLIDGFRSRFDRVRWATVDSLHLTLAFLGDVDDVKLADVCHAIQGAAAQHDAFSLSLHGLGTFPDAGNPRVFWVGIRDGRAESIALADDLWTGFEEIGFVRESRPFTPHLTIGLRRDSRRGGGGRAHRPDEAWVEELAEEFARRADWEACVMRVDQVVAYASESSPAGPQYSVIARAPLRIECAPSGST